MALPAGVHKSVDVAAGVRQLVEESGEDLPGQSRGIMATSTVGADEDLGRVCRAVPPDLGCEPPLRATRGPAHDEQGIVLNEFQKAWEVFHVLSSDTQGGLSDRPLKLRVRVVGSGWQLILDQENVSDGHAPSSATFACRGSARR